MKSTTTTTTQFDDHLNEYEKRGTRACVRCACASACAIRICRVHFQFNLEMRKTVHMTFSGQNKGNAILIRSRTMQFRICTPCPHIHICNRATRKSIGNCWFRWNCNYVIDSSLLISQRCRSLSGSGPGSALWLQCKNGKWYLLACGMFVIWNWSCCVCRRLQQQQHKKEGDWNKTLSRNSQATISWNELK